MRAVVIERMEARSRAEAIEVSAYEGGAVKSLKIDFRANQRGGPLDATYASHGWEIDRGKTSQAVLKSGAAELAYKASVGPADRNTGGGIRYGNRT